MSSDLITSETLINKSNSDDLLSDLLKVASAKTLQNKISEEIYTKAEDEIVAIIISAIMGNIIKRWEILSPLVEVEPSEMYSHIKSTVLEQVNDNNNSERFSQFNINEEYTETNSRQLTQNELESKANIYRSSISELTQKENIRFSNYMLDSTGSNSLKVRSINLEALDPKLIKLLFLEQKDKIFGWQFLETNPDVMIEFKPGHRYEGKLLNCRMHGWGKFYWADGSVYQGDFINGEMTGEGHLEWPDQSWYEGQLVQGYRHGLGLFVQLPMFYTGNWKCGFRHGLGSIFYNITNTQINYYNGEWCDDCKHGTGLRSYPSGAMYSGQWSKGVRHGLGTMVWTNNDVYSGNWENCYIHGYGEYTWATFFNNQLVVPEENCFYGSWDHGVRHGNGTLETNLGVIVRGTWQNGKKHGPAEVICSNGKFVYAGKLFVNDSIGSVSDSSVELYSLMGNSLPGQLYKVPVNAANHDINLAYYTDRLKEYITQCERNKKPFRKTVSGYSLESVSVNSNKFSSPQKLINKPNESKFESCAEETLLQNVLLQYLSVLKVIYSKYSELCCDVKPNFSTVLMRLMLWQLFRDCNLHARGLSLGDLDIIIANNKATLVQGVHYPFERLQFWQFLHCIIEISWEFYGKQGSGTEYIHGVLASALHKLITSDILPNAGRHKGSALFKYKNLLSLDSVYWFYRGIGETHSARKFLKFVFGPREEENIQDNAPYYEEYLLHGRNVIGVGGTLTYYPKNEPLVPNSKAHPNTNHPQDLTCLSGIGLLDVVQCLLQVCPSIAIDGVIVNMDYKVIFLEFLEILFLCADQNAKLKSLQNKLEDQAMQNQEVEDLQNHIEQPIPLKESVSVDGKKKKTSIQKQKKKK